MDAKNWSLFFCNCLDSLDVDSNRIANPVSFISLASQPEKEIGAVAKIVAERNLRHLIIGCCAERSLFENALKGSELHFLDLKGMCFLPHTEMKTAHTKAKAMILAEINASKIKKKRRFLSTLWR